MKTLALLSALALLALTSPGCVITAEKAALSVSGAHYFPPETLDLTALLAKPPTNDSEITQSELGELKNVQASRTAADCAQAQADVDIDAAQFTAALGLPLRATTPTKLRRLVRRTHFLEAVIVDHAKDAFARTRPYELDPAIQPCVKKPSDLSYPSGHASWAYMTAALLSDLVPERRGEIFARADAFARSRIVGGVHFPSDVAAGRQAGLAIAQKLLGSPEYRAEADAVRAELRSRLSL